MIDLHTHSTYSDGSDTPTQLVNKAEKSGLSAIALTDHNTIDGLDEFIKASEGSQIETIPGIEISTATNNKYFHIIGLFIQPNHYNDINNYLKISINNKIQSNRTLVENLCKAGYNISYNEIVKDYGSENFTRVAIANALLKRGYITSIKEAFDDLISEKRGFFIPPSRLDTFKTITFLNSINALTVWAHPMKDTTFKKLDKEYLPKAKKCGLNAIETIHSSYTKDQVHLAKVLAKKHNLLQSGGSDYHGRNKQNVHLATGTGCNINVDYQVLQNLKNSL